MAIKLTLSNFNLEQADRISAAVPFKNDQLAALDLFSSTVPLCG